MEPNRGILFPSELPVAFRRLPADPELSHLVRWWWLASWRLKDGEVSRQNLLAYPTCNLAVEPTLVGLAGPSTRASFRDLAGTGWVVGAALQPAAVGTLIDAPSLLRDHYEALPEPGLHAAVIEEVTHHGLAAGVGPVSEWLLERAGAVPEEALLANRLLAEVESAERIDSVDKLALRLSLSVRTLHRLSLRYLGLTPHAIIRRRRVQHAALLIRTQPKLALSTVATECGYSDQAHLSRDFRRTIDFSPSFYRAAQPTASNDG